MALWMWILIGAGALIVLVGIIWAICVSRQLSIATTSVYRETRSDGPSSSSSSPIR
jgi:hypothetical protein